MEIDLTIVLSIPGLDRHGSAEDRTPAACVAGRYLTKELASQIFIQLFKTFANLLQSMSKTLLLRLHRLSARSGYHSYVHRLRSTLLAFNRIAQHDLSYPVDVTTMEGKSSLGPLIKLHETDISRSGIDHSTKELASQIFFQLFGTSTTL